MRRRTSSSTTSSRSRRSTRSWPKGMEHALTAFQLVSVTSAGEGSIAEASEPVADGQTRTCPSCGEDNPSAFRLCGSCGASLSVARRRPREPQDRDDRLRRSEAHDGLAARPASPEALRDVMSRYFDAMRPDPRTPRRHGREVHRRRGHGGLRPAGAPRGRRPARGPGRRRHAGRARRASTRSSRAELGRDPRATAPASTPARSSPATRRRPAAGHRRRGQRRGAARAGGGGRSRSCSAT